MASFMIQCSDSLVWLQKQPNRSIKNIVTGIPDLNELDKNMTIEQYIKFLTNTCQLIFEKIRDDGYCIFIQTDRKFNGQWIDKSYYLTDTAYKNGFKLVWHKIVCQRDIGKTDLHRPTYSHFLCYTIHGKPGSAFMDVIPVSHKLYDNATPTAVSDLAIQFLSKQIKKQKSDSSTLMYDVVDLFVGRGTIGASSIRLGLSFLGIDIDPTQCELTKSYLKDTF